MNSNDQASIDSEPICLKCGLCCNGSVFADVELRGSREATGMESLGLEIEEEEGVWLLMQPCRALRGTKCDIYPHRPECCRRFECKVLKDYQSGKLEEEDAVIIVTKAQSLIRERNLSLVKILIDRKFLNQPVDVGNG